MTRAQHLKVWTTVFIIFAFSFLIAVRISAQSVGPAPTLANCNCIQVKGFKQTKDNLSIGTVTVYSDQVVFKFNSTIKAFFKYSNEVWIDDKENMWLLLTTEDGTKIFKNKNTIYFYEDFN